MTGRRIAQDGKGPFSVAIFDLDGLLVDTEPTYWQMYRELLRPFGKDMSLEDYAQHYSGGTRNGNLAKLIEGYDLPVTLDEAIALQDGVEPRVTSMSAPAKPGAAELLRWLCDREVRTILATSSHRERAERLLEGVGLLSFFDWFAFGPEVECPKPAPDVFLLAARRAGAIPAECVVFEDSESGVLAAHAAGMRVVCVPDMRRPRDEVAQRCWMVLDSLVEATQLLDEFTAPQVIRRVPT